MLQFSIIAGVIVITAVVLILVIRQDRKVSAKLAAVARRKGLKFERKDRLGIRRTLNRTFIVKGSGTTFGWVRDVAFDSKVRLFRLNVVHQERKSILSKPKTTITQCIGALFPGMGGPSIAVETDGWKVLNTVDPSTGKDTPADLRSRALGAHLKKDHAPFPLHVVFAGDEVFAYLKPPMDADEYGESYRYLMDLADGLFDTRMGDLVE